MNITIKPVTTWERVVDAARITVWKDSLGHEPTPQFKNSILKSEHSPIRLLEFDILFKDIPSYVMGHLVRHHEGCEKFVSTNREDRNNVKPEDVNRLTPVNMLMACNAQSLINISRVRLCSNADSRTIITWSQVKRKMQDVDPAVAFYMVPNCVYKGFCPESHCCGYVNTPNYQSARDKYLKGYNESQS